MSGDHYTREIGYQAELTWNLCINWIFYNLGTILYVKVFTLFLNLLFSAPQDFSTLEFNAFLTIL